MKFILVRHGETVENKNGIVQGQIEGQLTKKGLRQAKRTGRKLAKTPIDSIYSSDLKRCLDTAEQIVKHHPNLQVIKEPRLREINFGQMQGRPSAQMDGDDMPGWGIFVNDFWNAKIEGGETNTQLQTRVVDFINSLLKTDFKNVLLVTHGGPIRHLIALSRNEDASLHWGTRAKNGEIVVVEFNSPLELNR